MFDSLKELYYLNKTYRFIRRFDKKSSRVFGNNEVTAGYHDIAEDLKVDLENNLLTYDDRDIYPSLLKPLGLKYWLLMDPLAIFVITTLWLITTIVIGLNIIYAIDATFHLNPDSLIILAVAILGLILLLASSLLACHKILNLLGKDRTEKRINYLEDFLDRTAPSKRTLTLVKKNLA